MHDTSLQANFIDQHVGICVRTLRLQHKITQSDLAAKLGVSFQQVQKYETGANRISASKLYSIAQALEVKPGYFFDGLDGNSDHLGTVEIDLDAAHIADLISKASSKEAKACLQELIRLITLQEIKTAES